MANSAATGAGSEMRHATGVAVFVGMLLRAMTGNRPLVQHGTMKEATAPAE